MSISDKKLPLDGNACLLSKLATDYETLATDEGLSVVEALLPKTRRYIIQHKQEPGGITREARKAVWRSMQPGFKKVAFDTRRIDQENDRNPRTNLQYWQRSQQFLDSELQAKINIFGKVLGVLKGIKESFGTEPEYFESHSRVLYDQIERVLRIKQGDQEIFRPQVAYLEQLLYTRYRLSTEEIVRMSDDILRRRILDKDEALLKRGVYINETGREQVKMSSNPIVIDGNKRNTQQNIIEAIFGNTEFRRVGEKKVERTITITICDEVKE